MRKVRLGLYAVLNLAVGALMVAVISIGPGSAPDLRALRELEGRLAARFELSNLKVGFQPGMREGEVSLGIVFTAAEGAYTDRRRLEKLVDQIRRRAVLDYRGHPAGVSVRASAPRDLLLVGIEPDYASYTPLQEILDAISGADLLAYGDARWGVPDPSDRWRTVVIHHSASERGSAAIFDRDHRYERHWSGGLGYHFVIGNGNPTPDGFVEVGSRWTDQADGAHAGVREFNHRGIGICLVGNFEETYPTPRQMASLRALVRWIHLAFHIPYDQVIGHRDVKDTLCPGKNFPMSELHEWLYADEDRRLGLMHAD